MVHPVRGGAWHLAKHRWPSHFGGSSVCISNATFCSLTFCLCCRPPTMTHPSPPPVIPLTATYDVVNVLGSIIICLLGAQMSLTLATTALRIGLRKVRAVAALCFGVQCVFCLHFLGLHSLHFEEVPPVVLVGQSFAHRGSGSRGPPTTGPWTPLHPPNEECAKGAGAFGNRLFKGGLDCPPRPDFLTPNTSVSQ